MSQDKHHNYKLAASVVAVLVAFAGSYFLATWYRGDAPETVEPADTSRHTEAPARHDTLQSDDEKHVPVQETPVLDTQPELKPIESTPGSDVGRSSYLLRLAFVDRSGTPVPGVEAECRIMASVVRGGTENREIKEQVSLTSDLGGECQIEIPRGDSIRIDISNVEWFCLPLERTPVRDSIQRIILDRACSVQLNVMFDDGMPFTGHGEMAGDLFAGDAYSVSFACGPDGLATVPQVRVSTPLTCTIFASRRPGYSTYRELMDESRLKSNAPILIVVQPSTQPESRVRVLFDTPVPEGCTILVERQQSSANDSSIHVALASGSESWTSERMRPGTKCRVSVLGNLSWRSDWIETDEPKVHEVKAALSKSGSARAVLIDEAGIPVSGAVLKLTDGEYVEYDAAGAPKATAGVVSDSDGVVVLAGLPPGIVQLEAEANGREVIERTANIRSGKVEDLGSIVLYSARGRIEVKLDGTVKDATYRVQLVQPGVKSLGMVQTVSGETHVYSNLPCRSYTVTVYVAPGGSVRQHEVVLSSELPEQVIEIDVKGLKSKTMNSLPK